MDWKQTGKVAIVLGFFIVSWAMAVSVGVLVWDWFDTTL